MWVYTKPRNEHDKRQLLDLAHFSVVTVSQLGERWFVDAVMGSDSSPLASANSQEEANTIVEYIFDSLKAGENAIDLNLPPQKVPKQSR
jgi:hypothetical protein